MEGHEEENSGGGHHLSPLSSSPLSPSGHDYLLQEAASMGVSGADVPAAAAALAPTASISTTPPATTSVLLSMMHSMPFLVFGPQLAAAAAALAASNHHHHHHQMKPESAQQTNHLHNRALKRCSPNSSSSSNTDFSIDSILNDRGSSSTRSSVQLAPKVPGTSSSSAQFSAWSTATLGNGSYDAPAPPVPPYHQHHLCDPSSPFPWLSSQQQLHNSPYFQYNTSSSSPYKVNHSPTTTTTTTAEADHTSKHCSPKSTDSNCSSTSSAGPKSGTPGSKQQRKTLNRGPRIPFTSAQVAELEAKFAATQYLSSMEVSTLAKRLSLTDIRVSAQISEQIAWERHTAQLLNQNTESATVFEGN